MSAKTPVSPDALAGEFSAFGPAADRVRLVGLDHAGRLQQGRIGAAERRLLLARARRPGDAAAIAGLEVALAAERRVDGALGRAVTRAEIEIPARSPDTAVLHGLVIAAEGGPAGKVTVAAVRADGSVRRFTCTDAKGYFRMDLTPGGDAVESVFLQVSDAEQSVLYRGDEAIPVAPGTVAYREIRLSGDRLEPCPLPPDRATMPRLLDLPEAEALAVLERLGLGAPTRLTQTAPGREGLIVSQEPAAGTPVTADTSVTLVVGVAEDGETVAVPEVVGLGADNARSVLTEAGLALGQITRQASDEAPGTVLAQSPRAGVRVAAGTAVDLTVAEAPPDDRIDVPDLVDRKLEEATAILTEAGLTRGRVTFRDDDRVGLVVDQAPEAGTPVPKETAVSLVVGREPQAGTVAVPRLAGQTLAGAREILAASRLRPGTIEGDSTGLVVGQRPAAGTAVPPGSAVDLTLEARGGGRPSTPVRPAPQPPIVPRPTREAPFAERLSRQMAADPAFAGMEVSAASVRDTLAAGKVDGPRAAERIVSMGNAELRDMFGLRDGNRARTFRRLMREAVQDLEKGED